MSKRIVTLVLALMMVLGTVTGAFAEEVELTPISLDDLTTDAEPVITEEVSERISKLLELGLIQGKGNGDLALNTNITRAEAATIVVRALGQEELAKTSQTFNSQFTDMYPGHWANGYVNIASASGIVAGYPNKEFRPENNITYSEAATMLVRVVEDLTLAEKAAAKWPLNYLTKANSLGILKDVAIDNYNSFAVRGQVFELFFNALAAKADSPLAGAAVAVTLEGIVVDNYRTSALDSNEIRIVLTDDEEFVDNTAKVKNEEGDQVEIKLPEGQDAEELLGKGVIVTLDKDNKLIEVKVDDSYTYIVGAVEDIEDDRLEVADKTYKVDEKALPAGVYFNGTEVEFYNEKSDKELFDLVADETKEVLARLTVKSGRIVFLEAFAFEDVAPVSAKEDSKNRISYYNDARGGDVSTLDVKDAQVIELNEDKFTVGEVADLTEGTVAQWFFTGKKADELVIIVRTDAKVVGKYTETTAAGAKAASDIEITVDKEDYAADLDTANRNPVYSVSVEDKEYYTLSSDYDVELSVFEDKEVTVLLDIFGKVQLISADDVKASNVGVITDIYKDEIEILSGGVKAEWFETDRNTKFENVGTGSRDSKLAQFAVGDVVKFAVADDVLSRLELLDVEFSPKAVTKFNTDVIDFGTEHFFLGAKTTVVVEDGDDFHFLTVKEFIKNYDTKGEFDATVVANISDAKLADVVIVSNIVELDNDKYDTKTVKVEKITFSGDDYKIVVLDETNSKVTYNVVGNAAKTDIKNLVIYQGSVVEAKVTKDGKEVRTIVEIIDEDAPVFEITKIDRDRSRGEDELTLKDANGVSKKVYLSRDTVVFGEYAKGDFVAIGDLDAYDTVEIVDVRDADVADGVWIHPDVTAAKAVEAKIIALPTAANLVLADEAKVAVARESFEALTAEQKALVTNVATLVAAEAKIDTLKLGNANQVIANQVIIKIGALPEVATLKLEDEAVVVAARASFDGLSVEQQALVTNVNVLVAAETKIEDLKDAAADKDAADLVIAEITALPLVDALELTDEQAVVDARTSFDALTEDQQALVTNVNVLVAAETKIQQLNDAALDQAAAQLVIDEIDALPALSEFNTLDPVQVQAVEDARVSFDALTEDQQALVTNVAELEALEAALA